MTRYYYEKPDGQDLLGKVVTSVRLGMMAAVPLAVHNAILRTASDSALVKFMVGLRPISYLGGIGFIFANVTYMSTRLRGKDDALNHGIGALATTPLVKAFLKIPAVEVADLMIYASIAMMVNKARRTQESGLEEPFKYYYSGIRNELPNFDYWEYWTGEETPADTEY